MLGRLRKSLTYILYLVIGLLFAALLFWLRGLSWSAKYQELHAKFFWPFMAVVLVVFAVIYYQEAQKDEKDPEDDA